MVSGSFKATGQSNFGYFLPGATQQDCAPCLSVHGWKAATEVQLPLLGLRPEAA